MTLGELKRIIDAVHDLHGPDAQTRFVYQRASGRTGIGDLTSFRVGLSGLLPSVHFTVEYARGELEQ